VAKTTQSAGRNNSQSLCVVSIQRARGLQLGTFDAHCPKYRKRQLFSNQHSTQNVSPWAFLCVTTLPAGVVSHPAFSSASEGFLLLLPFPGSDGISSILFKPGAALPAYLALGSDFCLCLVLEISIKQLPLAVTWEIFISFSGCYDRDYATTYIAAY